jgi:translation initiation factor 1A
MPNLQGGKKYKSGKGGQDVKAELHEIGDGQMVGRVIRNLGNRRMLIFCNDTRQRICKIRGSLRKKTAYINIGDIVLIGLREELATGKSSSTDISGERGDILAKYDPSIFGKLKKEEGVNPQLFLHLETMEVAGNANATNILGKLGEDGQEDLFERDGEEDSSEDDSDDDEEVAKPTPSAGPRNRDKRLAPVDIDAI